MSGAATSRGPRPVRLHALDLTRGLCALCVIVYHFLLWTGTAHIESMGTFSVYIFFILSSLTMAHCYGKAFKSTIDLTGIQGFFVNRIARILPLLFLTALAMQVLRVISSGTFDGSDFARFLLTASGLFSLHAAALSSNTVGAWSLAIEILFYVMFPILMLFVGNARKITILVCSLALIPIQHAGIALSENFAEPVSWYLYANPLVFAPFFAFGFLIQKDAPTLRRDNLPLGIVLVGVVGLFSFIFPVDIMKSTSAYLFLTAVSFAVVYVMYHAYVPKALRRVSGFLGEISYSVYLVHWFVFQGVTIIGTKFALPLGVTFACFFVVSCVVAYFTYRWIEMPLQRWVRRALSGKEKQE